MLDGLGPEARAVAADGHPTVLGRWEKALGRSTVLLDGPGDVQPFERLEA